VSGPGRRAALRVLFLALEFPRWDALARHVSYASSLGIEAALSARGADVFTVTTPWFWRARELCRGRAFDQVWIEIARYERFSEEWLEWMASQAPVRLGLMAESRTYAADEVAVNPQFFTGATERIDRRLTYVTHVAAVDERDAREVGERFVPAVWWPQAVPRRCIAESPPPPRARTAVFGGSLYGARRDLLAHPDVGDVLVPQRSSESGTWYPALFDGLHHGVRALEALSLRAGPRTLAAYLRALRRLRQTCFARWLASMQEGVAVVNLPSSVKAYAGRVPEAMAAGRPVISWRVPDRPRTEALFTAGREILLFDADRPEQLAEHARRLIRDDTLARAMTDAARAKLRRFHTLEHRVGQLLDWLDAGTEPDFGEGASALK
jgi:hypothetical protein